ncbi:hypothetical protein JL2886_00855 [Phaeobacter gallaeciensis]|uniref:Uncharacterized protein n=1 Tax=Phaeobacter gallaeciensis TaxID=60890 RepID=A0A1B0ZNP4_9RHOB|nr:hypothetical protein JL2886_00855 [Phaeobacter gallaeciensis]
MRHPLQPVGLQTGGRARPSGGGAAFLWWGGCHRDALVVWKFRNKNRTCIVKVHPWAGSGQIALVQRRGLG